MYGKQLIQNIHQELKDLYLEDATFDIHFETQISDDMSEVELTANGIDKIHFQISTNKGEPLMDLTQVASGGELSRIMLSLKKIFSKRSEERRVGKECRNRGSQVSVEEKER